MVAIAREVKLAGMGVEPVADRHDGRQRIPSRAGADDGSGEVGVPTPHQCVSGPGDTATREWTGNGDGGTGSGNDRSGSSAVLGMSVAERCLLLRRRLGLTQPELAAKLGVSETTVWKLENGKRMKPATIARFEVFEARHGKVTSGK